MRRLRVRVRTRVRFGGGGAYDVNPHLTALRPVGVYELDELLGSGDECRVSPSGHDHKDTWDGRRSILDKAVRVVTHVRGAVRSRSVRQEHGWP